MFQSCNLSTLFSFDTEFSADSVEWCPHAPNQNVFVCANYQLKENETFTEMGFQKRIGRIMLFSIVPKKGLNLLQTINTAAVLDQKWCHIRINNDSILGVVNAEGRIEIYKLNSNVQLELICYYEIKKEKVETLVLSLDWSTGILQTNQPEIICSDSKGDIHLLQLVNNIIWVNSWHGHNFEAWIAGFYYWDTNIFFTGGDDSVFLEFDRRIGNEPIAINKSHNAGVTSLHSSYSKENILVTGSYDEHIRLWDIRNIKNEINKIKMPGTLWRLKWDPFYQNCLLAACMLNGVHIVDVKNQDEMIIVASYYEHKNISYGADWSYLEENICKQYDTDAEAIIATCSFYDHLLCVSKFSR